MGSKHNLSWLTAALLCATVLWWSHEPSLPPNTYSVVIPPQPKPHSTFTTTQRRSRTLENRTSKPQPKPKPKPVPFHPHPIPISPPIDPHVKFYIYSDNQIAMHDFLNNCTAPKPKAGFKLEMKRHHYNSKITADSELLRLMRHHPRRTRNPKEATWFIIPMPFWTLALCGCDVKRNCTKAHHALRSLVNHPIFQKTKGYNHFLPSHSWRYFGRSNSRMVKRWYPLLENITVGHFEYYGMSKWENHFLLANPKLASYKPFLTRRAEHTKHTIVMPYKAEYPIGIHSPNFQSWRRRSINFFFHTRNESFYNGGNELRKAPVKKRNLFYNSSVGYDIPLKKWINGWRQSKFCLVLRGDTPTSHAFYNAISAACIPVVISNYFKKVGVPFPHKISLDSIAIDIREQTFLRSPAKVFEMIGNFSEAYLEDKLRNITEIAQPALLYNHNMSTMVDDVLVELLSISSKKYEL